jgi:myo-inositol-1(or 4)-monophosphatase
MILKDVCSRAERAIRETGEFIEKESIGFDIKNTEVKGLNNFVSYVDREAERMLIEKLTDVIPDAGFIAEEGTTYKRGKLYNWVIDPLDGTTNFLHGVHPYAISVGLTYADEIIAGVVHEPGQNETFIAWKYGGAWLNGNRIKASDVPSLSDALVATGFPYSQFNRLTPYMELLTYLVKNTHGIRRLGSASIDLAYVACGRFDVFFEYDLKPWDITAGTIILREAGGKVSDFRGNMKGLTGDEIIAANALVFPEILGIIGDFMNNIPD